jgi:hypothetical protein
MIGGKTKNGIYHPTKLEWEAFMRAWRASGKPRLPVIIDHRKDTTASA